MLLNLSRCKDAEIPPDPEQCHRHPQDVSRVLRLAEVLRGAHPGYLQSKTRNRQITLPWEAIRAHARLSYTLQPGYGSIAAASRPNDLKSVQEAQDRRESVSGRGSGIC